MGDFDKGDNMKGKEPVICKNSERYLRMLDMKLIW